MRICRRDFGDLYARPVRARRSGPLFNCFSYPTKVDPELVALFLATHTDPGGTVLDPFGGSGSTGIAARLCDQPTPRMQVLAREMSLEPIWGPRHAVVYELSPLGVLLASVMCEPPNPSEFAQAADELIAESERRLGWMYDAKSPAGGDGVLRYAVWSEVLITPCCSARITFWDAVVELNPAAIRDSFSCPTCGELTQASRCERATRTQQDPLTGQQSSQRHRVMAQVYGRSGTRMWSRPPVDDDQRLACRIRSQLAELAPSAPIVRVEWGDLRRSGYHLGIDHIHHLYTPRNLSAVASFWEGINGCPPKLQDSLRLLVLSYNSSHSTQLARVVAKQGQRDLIVTGAQSGVLYLSGLPVEKHVFAGVRRKIRTFKSAFSLADGSRSTVRVVCGSSTAIDLATDSVDYVFTDPPFGGYIPYAEVNQVNEAWLGRFTDRTQEAIISPAQGKDVEEYGRLLSSIFGEVARVLRPSGLASIIFHSSSVKVWHALSRALSDHGFVSERSSLLDRQQPTFKQAASGAQSNTVLLLRTASDPPDSMP